MTKRYPGGYITKTPPTVSTTSAPGIWTMEQQAAYQKAGTWPFGGPFNYIEDVFSTWLYTGNGSTQTITNGIDLAGQGGLTWIKKRNAAEDHILTDTVRGAGNTLFSNLTSANEYDITRLSAFTSSGFSVGTSFRVNQSSNTYASWTFRKQPKFFDVVTYTGNGTSQNIAHNLGSVPGCIIVKSTSTVNDWRVYHRSLATVDSALRLNSTAAAGSSSTFWNSTAPTSTQFTVGSDGSVNANGATYVAYLFAHNAGGFGLTGTDNVISCGGFTVSGGATTTVNLGYEPQWVLIKRVDTTGNWELFDSMRGFSVDFNNSAKLFPNLSDAESSPGGSARVAVTSTGFQYNPAASADQMIYIAIRRGPMKTPTSGTSVFEPVAQAAGGFVTTNFAVDSVISTGRTNPSAVGGIAWLDRLRGSSIYSVTSSTAAETNAGSVLYGWNYSNVGYQDYAYAGTGASGIYWSLRRAPGFFDEVCYTGNGATQNVSHNLGVAPELMFIKSRSAAGYWPVYAAPLGNGAILQLEDIGAVQTGAPQWNSTTPTASVFSLGTSSGANASGTTFVAYLFASCPGVSKVGSYTGTGATQTINCGFAARFVLIKRTDSTGSWFVWDTARGMVAGTDPRLALNSTAAETNANWVYTDASGFQIVTTDATVNASGGSYVYLAIA